MAPAPPHTRKSPPPSHAGGILCTASVLLLPAGLAGSLMTLGDEPLHGLLDFIGRAILAAVLVAGPAGGLAIGCWLVRRGAGAVGWRAAAALAVYAAVLTAPLVFHRPWLLQFFIALVYGADVGVANRLVWQRWGAPGAAFTACFAVAFVTAVFHFV